MRVCVCPHSGCGDPHERGAVPPSDQRATEPSSPADAAAAEDQRPPEGHRGGAADPRQLQLLHQHEPLLHTGTRQVTRTSQTEVLSYTLHKVNTLKTGFPDFPNHCLVPSVSQMSSYDIIFKLSVICTECVLFSVP